MSCFEIKQCAQGVYAVEYRGVGWDATYYTLAEAFNAIDTFAAKRCLKKLVITVALLEKR